MLHRCRAVTVPRYISHRRPPSRPARDGPSPKVSSSGKGQCKGPPSLHRWYRRLDIGVLRILLAILFLHYVVFEQPSKLGDSKATAKATRRRTRRFSVSSHFSAKTGISASDLHLLQKLNYELQSHAPESCDWLNVLVAQAVTGYRNMVILGGAEGRGAQDYVEKMLNTHLAAEEQSAFVRLEHIAVTDVDVGDDFPVCTNARVRPSNDAGRVRIEFDVDYTDHVKLGLDTCIIVNFPRPRFAILPVSLGLTLAKFSATLTIEVPPTPSPAPPILYASLHPDFTLEVNATSLIGSKAKLQDIPKVEQLVVGRIRAFVIQKFVWPKRFPIKLPSLQHPTADELEYEFIDQDVPDDDGVAQRLSPTPDAGDFDEEVEIDDHGLRPPDMDHVVRTASPAPRAISSALQHRLQPPAQSPSPTNVFRQRQTSDAASSQGDGLLPGHLPRKAITPPPIRGMSPWRPNDQLLRGTSPSPSPAGRSFSYSGYSERGVRSVIP